MQVPNKWGFRGPDPQLAQLCHGHCHTCRDECAPANTRSPERLLGKCLHSAGMCKSAGQKKSAYCWGFMPKSVICFWTSLHIQIDNLVYQKKTKLFFYTVISWDTAVEFYAFLVEGTFCNKYISVCIAQWPYIANKPSLPGSAPALWLCSLDPHFLSLLILLILAGALGTKVPLRVRRTIRLQAQANRNCSLFKLLEMKNTTTLAYLLALLF